MNRSQMIKQARWLMLRSLERVYESGMMPKMLYQIMCTVDESYGFDLMRKDIAYLRDKGYLTLLTYGGKANLADIREDSLVAVKLTATGLEVAQNIKDDPALEI